MLELNHRDIADRKLFVGRPLPNKWKFVCAKCSRAKFSCVGAHSLARPLCYLKATLKRLTDKRTGTPLRRQHRTVENEVPGLVNFLLVSAMPSTLHDRRSRPSSSWNAPGTKCARLGASGTSLLDKSKGSRLYVCTRLLVLRTGVIGVLP